MSKVQIGHETWTIQYVPKEALKDCYAFCDHASRTINLPQGSESEEATSLYLHELLHALWAYFGLPEDDKLEEQVVTALANGLMLYMKTNEVAIRPAEIQESNYWDRCGVILAASNPNLGVPDGPPDYVWN
jgi:hypothetical protein